MFDDPCPRCGTPHSWGQLCYSCKVAERAASDRQMEALHLQRKQLQLLQERGENSDLHRLLAPGSPPRKVALAAANTPQMFLRVFPANSLVIVIKDAEEVPESGADPRSPGLNIKFLIEYRGWDGCPSRLNECRLACWMYDRNGIKVGDAYPRGPDLTVGERGYFWVRLSSSLAEMPARIEFVATRWR